MTVDPGPLADVGSEPAGDRWTLVFARDLAHPPATVWAALTEPDRLSRWAPYTADRDLGSTGAATLTMIDADAPVDLPGTVTIAESPALLEHVWGGDLLRWDLVGAGAGTRLTLRHTMADRAFLPMAAAGWHLCLVVAAHLLDGAPIDPIRGAAARAHGWDALADAYTDRLSAR